MDFKNKKYDFEGVNCLIEKNDLSSASKYMIKYTKSKKYSSSNLELVQCRSRLKRIEADHRKGIINYEVYDKYKNKITNHLIYLNNEIDSIDSTVRIDSTDKLHRRKKLLTNIRSTAEFSSIATLVFVLSYCLIKLIVPYFTNEKKIVEFLPDPPYNITGFFVTFYDCADSSYVSFKIENTSNHNLDSIQFIWTPHNLSNLSEESDLIALKIKETKRVQIPFKIQNKFKPDVYPSLLEEIHPVSINRKFQQNFKVTPCENNRL